MKNSLFGFTGATLAAAVAMNTVGVANASVAGAQGLYAHNYIVSDAGVDYSVMDVYIKFNSAVGTGTGGERVVNVFGQATTDASTGGVNKTAKAVNSAGLNFQHSNVSWLPGSGANGGQGNNTWDSFVTIGCRTQGGGNSANVGADPYFTNPNSGVGAIVGGSNATPAYVGAGWGQNAPSDAGFETNAGANADHLVMMGRFSLKVSDIQAFGSPVTMQMWLDWTGKSTAQTGGTTMYTMASVNLKSDAATTYTTGGKTWNFASSFDGVSEGQAAWTFYAPLVPTPGVASLIGVAGALFGRRRRA